MRKTLWPALMTFLGMIAVSSFAEDQHTDLNSLGIQEVHILGHHANIIGQTLSASEGTISQADLIIRPLLRTGEILEAVPGLVATQHSGSGKANQYFLRGFNLDHGTDFATSIDGMPVNMRTHGHGQGYTDINFIIPELVGGIHYKKGPYYSDVGDFSGAGAANIVTVKTSEEQFSLALGEWNFARGLLIGETPAANGKLIYGIEHQVYSGPWKDIDEDVGKTNLWLKQKWKTDVSSFELLFMGYDNQWNSADQIPERAVQQGLIDELGSIDTSVGGESSRYSLSTKFRQKNEKGDLVQANIYAIDYDMTLWSNFSYFTDPDGDQFQQIDDRIVYGGDLSLTLNRDFFSREMVNTFGVETRVDDIREVGLNRTKAREFLSSIRTDTVDEASISAYWKGNLVLTEHLRTVLGVRQDYFSFDVTPLTAANSNSLELNNNQVSDDITRGSLSVIYAINQQQEIYSSIGQGFHSNDARGVTLSVDPNTAEVLNPADPLVGTLGYELGWRGNYNQLNLSFALWHLEIDSELLFVGDEGVTEDTGISSTREGIELTAYFHINNDWMFDIEYAYSNAEFDAPLDGSTTIPGALKKVLTTGINWQVNDRFFTHVRVRHLGKYPLDAGATADASTMVNWRMAYEFNNQIEFTCDVLNLLGSNDRDIEYFYESQLPGEGSPVDDHHYHIFEPRSLRLATAWSF